MIEVLLGCSRNELASILWPYQTGIKQFQMDRMKNQLALKMAKSIAAAAAAAAATIAATAVLYACGERDLLPNSNF